MSMEMRLVCSADTSDFANYRFLAHTRYPTVAFTLPADGTYYLWLYGPYGNPGPYRIRTTWDTPSAGERARDHRDQFVAWSDDGVVWGTPRMLTDGDPWFDGIFPELTVDETGAVHAFWHDWRGDTGCGALSYEYMASSGDGGATWGANRRVSDVLSFWSAATCGSANQGDYQGIASQGSTVYPCWADSRLGDPDIYMEADRFEHAPVCPGPQAINGGTDVQVGFTLSNNGNVPGDFAWTLSDDNGWLTGATPGLSGTVSLAAGASQPITATLEPSSACYPSTVDTVRLIASDLNIPGRVLTCETVVTCSPTAGVEPTPLALAFAPPRPNPTTGATHFGFTLPRAGQVRLAIYGANGGRVRLLADAGLPAGRYERTWNGRDDAGRRVAPGLYYARLEVGGKALERTVALIR
jgi:hypothetical protein